MSEKNLGDLLDPNPPPITDNMLVQQARSAIRAPLLTTPRAKSFSNTLTAFDKSLDDYSTALAETIASLRNERLGGPVTGEYKAPQIPTPQDFMAEHNAAVPKRQADSTTRNKQTQDFDTWYSNWAKTNGMSLDPFDPRHQYDYKAAYKAGVQAPVPGAHWPSEFKTAGHPNRIIHGIDTRTGEGSQSLNLAFKDPLPSFGGEASLQSADPLSLGALLTQGALQPGEAPEAETALPAVAQMMTPQYLQEDYKGPQTGSQIEDILVALGQVLNAGSGAGSLGAAAPLASRTLGPAGTTMGTFGGRNARFADLRKLDSAQGLEAAGAPSQEILQGTGWFKDVDGHWKFEISDQLAKLTPKAEDLIGQANTLDKAQAGGGTLRDYISNPELELNYPGLFGTKMAFVGNPMSEFGPRSRGSYTPAWETDLGQKVPPKLGVAANAPEAALSTLIHEPEHMVQFEEGFARGGSPVDLAKDMYETVSTDFKDLKPQILAALAKEPELAGMPLRTDPKWQHPGDVPTLIETLARDRPSRGEMQYFLKWFEGRPENFKQELLPLVKPWLKNFLELGALPQPEDAFDYYFGLLGEANARAASLRQPFTKQQRLDIPLEETRRTDPLRSPLEGYLLDFDPTKPIEEQLRK